MATPGKNASAQTVRPANSQTHHTFLLSRYGNESSFEASGLSPTISSFLGSHFTTKLVLGDNGFGGLIVHEVEHDTIGTSRP